MTIEIGNGPKPVIPLKKQCWKTSCANPPELQVGLVLIGVHNGRQYPIDGESGVVTCKQHQPEMTIEYMVTDEGWKMICDGFRLANRIEPTRELTKLRFLPILKL